MSVLLVDIGNTRVKWASFARERVGRMNAVAHKGWGGERIARHVVGTGLARTAKPSNSARGSPRVAPNRIERVVVVSVAGATIDRAFAAEMRLRFGITPEFFRSERHAGGVTTLYSEPWRLGADRLAGAIGGFHLSKHRPVCIVSVGTTMTLDFVDGSGRHRGGAIVPAPDLMIDSLLWGTHGIRRRARGGRGSKGLFARSTRSAIAEGARYAVAAVADRAVLEARALVGRTPLLLLTGGAAADVARLIRSRHRYVPDLVLQGLAVAASARPLRG
ncbi:MAG: type III pantothenate kinase [Gammaproteobacteria bacterium]